MTKTEKEAAKKKTIKIKEQRFYRRWALVMVILFSLIYFSFAENRGFHKAYPYISVFEKEKAVTNSQYLFDNIRISED